MNRSIITANYSGISNDNGKVSEVITIDDLMYYSLYWDKVIIPCNNIIYSELPQENEFIESGTLIRPRVNRTGIVSWDIQKIASIELIEVYKFFKDTIPNSDFSIHHNILNMFDDVSSPDLVKQQALRVELANLLPCPSNTNIYDLLEFKEKRKDELGDLHQHLTNLYLDIVNTNNSHDLKRLQVFNEFNRSINNLKVTMNEKFPNRLFFRNLVSELRSDLAELGATATADTALSTFPNGTLVGGITIFTKRVLTTILKEQKTDPHLNYIKSSIKEGIITN